MRTEYEMNAAFKVTRNIVTLIEITARLAEERDGVQGVSSSSVGFEYGVAAASKVIYNIVLGIARSFKKNNTVLNEVNLLTAGFRQVTSEVNIALMSLFFLMLPDGFE
ncbi:hypothetical protein NDU88_000847 [Pleurodeles waltl]|uniref:Uncharacterized protein n=1 Tax=Pleurodeles waltl TaxID=8319 RepID=A0AAV7NCI2_PLEWA|nr:hypothetical protein NDU88_000847 [Pleurodeles waltl]